MENLSETYLPGKQPAQDLAKVEHWENVWKQAKAVREVSRFSYYDFRMAKLLATLVGPGSRAIEIGCGGSRWIGFFAQTLKCETWGIDYSPEGIAITEQSNKGRSGIRLIQGDLFDESLLPLNYFDLVFSGGFIEHFTDPAVVTRRFAALLRSGGKVLTTTPNFAGIYKHVQKFIDRAIFEKHIPMNQTSLDEAHKGAGLQPVIPACFWGCFAPGVVNFGRHTRYLLPPITALQQAVCWSLSAIHLDRESRRVSPYIVGAYQKTR
jgi:SAM-dependent methyltransferase